MNRPRVDPAPPPSEPSRAAYGVVAFAVALAVVPLEEQAGEVRA
jgi:hypothetical protein